MFITRLASVRRRGSLEEIRALGLEPIVLLPGPWSEQASPGASAESKSRGRFNLKGPRRVRFSKVRRSITTRTDGRTGGWMDGRTDGSRWVKVVCRRRFGHVTYVIRVMAPGCRLHPEVCRSRSRFAYSTMNTVPYCVTSRPCTLLPRISFSCRSLHGEPWVAFWLFSFSGSGYNYFLSREGK